MTTSATTPRLSYVADGSTVQYTFNFEIADNASIAVYVGSTLKTLTTDYTVAFDSGTSGTGTITLLSAPADGSIIYLVRDTYKVRSTDFEDSGAFLASTVNSELDRLTQGLQDLENRLDNRVLESAEPNDESARDLTIPNASTRANKTLTFDASGDVQMSDAAGSVTSVGTGTGLTGGPITTSGTISIDSTVATLTGTQTLTNKTLTAPVINGSVTGDATYTTTSTSAGAIKTPTIQMDGNGATITVRTADTSLGLIPNGTGDVYATSDIIANGNLIATGRVQNDSITIGGLFNNQDAYIQGLRSNENIVIDPAGTGGITLNATTTLAGNIDMGGNTITGLSTAAPSADGDVANKKYVDDSFATISTNSLSQLDSSVVVSDSGSNGTITLTADGNTVLTATDAAGLTMSKPIAMGTNKITGLGTPTAGTDAVTKSYVDGQGFLTSVGGTISEGNSSATVADSGTGSFVVTVDGNNELTVTDDGVRVHGNLTVDGTQTILNTSTLSVEDNIITVNRNVSTVGAMPTNSGLEINRGDATAATLYWNETDDRWDISGTVSTAIRTNSITDQGLGIEFNNKTLRDIGTVISNSYTAQSGQDFYIGLQNNLAEAFRIVNSSGQNIITIDAGSGSDGDTVNFEGNINTSYTASRPFTFSNSVTFSNPVTVTGAISSNTSITANTFISDGAQMIDNIVEATRTNDDLELRPAGTGNVQISGIKYPNTDGSAGQILQTDGAGNISFVTVNTDGTGDLSIIGSTILAPSQADMTLSTTGSIGEVIVDSKGLAIKTPNTANQERPFRILRKSGTGTDLMSVLTPSSSSDQADLYNRFINVYFGGGTLYGGSDVNSPFQGVTNFATTRAHKIEIRDSENLTGIDIQDHDITTNSSNADLNLSANGSGTVTVNGLAFPTADGTNGQVLTTDGAGTLSFTDKSSLTIDPITFVGDDSTGTAVNTGETFKIAGGTNITTAVSGDTLTITGPDLSSYLTSYTETDPVVGAINGIVKANGAGTISAAVAGTDYLVTETNDLTSAVTWANVPDANITQSSVTQHQAALSITESQITDLGAYITDANITIVGDDSTGITFSAKNNDDIKITGTGGITSTVSGNTITIDGSGVSGGGSATGLTFVGDDSTGTLISDGETLKIAGGTGITTAMSGDTLTITSSGSASTGDFQFIGNNMSTSSSNADAEIEANGTGAIVLKANGGDISNISFTSGSRYLSTNMRYWEDLNHDASSRRLYANNDNLKLKLNGVDTSSSNARFYSTNSSIELDMNGGDSTNTSLSRGPINYSGGVNVTNTSATAATLGHAGCFRSSPWFYNSGSNGNIDVTNTSILSAYSMLENQGLTINATNVYGVYMRGPEAYSGGATTITNQYAFYYQHSNSGTTFTNDPYLLYTTDDSIRTNPGAINKFNEYSYTATHSSGGTYTIDWANGNLQTVTLTSNITGFTMSNFPTSTKQSVGITLYLVQDGTGSRTMSFTAATGETFKFANGANTSSVSSANDIQTVYIFTKYNGSALTYYWTLGPTYS